MRRPFIVLFALVLTGLNVTFSTSSPVGDAITEFAMDLHRAIQLDDMGENIIFSPLGVSLILGMIKLGASGATLHQIKRALKLQGNQESEEFSGLQTLFAVISEENKEFTFNLANALYLQEGFRVKEKYRHSNKKYFKTAIKLVNFHNSKASAETISAWVKMQTNGNITNLFSSDDIDPLTKMILVNAIYFKGEWKQKFATEATRFEVFKVKKGVTTKVPMMHLQMRTNIGYFSTKNLSYKILELPYKGDSLSLVLALPSEDTPIVELEKLMTTAVIKGWFADMSQEEVEISLPRFKIEHKVDLKKSLLNLNVTDIFNQNCDLSEITDTPNIYISKVVQKVSIEINEEGSEAAAATGMQAVAMSMTNHHFVADHPFLFFIKHNQSASILFMGKVTNPDERDARGRDVESL
ncbi:serpin I2 [Pelodytes ibericus]